MKGKSVFALVLVLSLLALGVGMGLAQGPGSEEGVISDTPQETFGAKNTQSIGDDPDEKGYSGTVVTGASAGAVPSEATYNIQKNPSVSAPQPDQDGYTGSLPQSIEPNVAPSESSNERLPDWQSFLQAPQPDAIGAPLAILDPNGPNWTDFYYVFAAGATMRPRDSGTAWEYPGVGCISAVDGNDLFTFHLDVPTGSRIDYLRIFFYDTSSSDSTAWITSYDGAGGVTDLVSVTSSGTAGYGTNLSAYLGYVVDNLNNGYVLNWRPSQASTTMRLCGLRVAYRLP